MLPDKTDKPYVLIYVFPHKDYENKIREVQAGLEEEGIPCHVVQSEETDVVALAYQGAYTSKLGVGVGIGEEGLCLHYGNLPKRQPLFTHNAQGTPATWRYFGYNAARLVKGIPFKGQAEEEHLQEDMDARALFNLVYGIVQKVLQETGPRP